MASPKRAWPPDRDSDGETAAAFEAAVAVVKASVARSGEMLSTAKEDLSDHQRWLKAQAAAVESDRERLAKWLHRQRERQEAFERREQARARRRAKRQAAIHAVRDRIAGAVLTVRMAVTRAVTTVAGGFSAAGAAVANGLGRIGGGLYRGAVGCAFHDPARGLLVGACDRGRRSFRFIGARGRRGARRRRGSGGCTRA
jgi:hypothetical protein